jgi:glycosyltransferase involved in cell wall biosynthesis
VSAPALSIVLPCYNEGGNLPGVLERFRKVRETLDFELVLVDNGSTDDSCAILERELARPENAFARVVTVPKNIGYGHGIQSGLKSCAAEVVGYSHADLQCPPEDIARAFRLFEKESAGSRLVLVKGRRTRRAFRDERAVSSVYNTLCRWVTGRDLGDVNAQPKMFHRSLLPELTQGPPDFSYDLFVLYRASLLGASLVEMEVAFEARQYGQSKWAHNRISRLKTILKALVRLAQIRAQCRWSVS